MNLRVYDGVDSAFAPLGVCYQLYHVTIIDECFCFCKDYRVSLYCKVLFSIMRCHYIIECFCTLGCVAQLVERLAYNEGVSGSNPFAPISRKGVFVPQGAFAFCRDRRVLKGAFAPLGALHYYMRLSTIKTCFFILVRVFIHSQLEAWLSGLRHRFAKSAYIVYVPWVQIPLLPRITLYAEDLISPKDISYRMLVLSHLLVLISTAKCCHTVRCASMR